MVSGYGDFQAERPSAPRTPDAMNRPGAIVWVDLTVADAASVRDFYAAVAGWIPAEVSMGDYSDYTMASSGDAKLVAGICHARGTNADLPPQWLIYITVPNLDLSIQRCRELGGSIITEPKNMGAYGRLAVIQDPAGAVAALLEPAQPG
jgi:predicted enzyme related to lactoylglutathione lyase